MDQVKNKDVILSGDGGCDSPGKSMNYYTYSVMDINTDYILHTETVDKREVALQSPNMEKEGFVRSLQFLLPQISCKEIITDASTAIHHELGEYTTVELYADIYCSYKTPRHISFIGRLAQVKENEKSFD